MWRIGMILFSVIALLGVGILAVLWFAWPPLMPAAELLASQSWFFVAETVLLGITAAGLVGMIVFALAAPRKSKQLIVERDHGGVRLSQAAIASTVRKSVEAHRGLTVKKVSAKVVGRANPHMRIRVKIEPGMNTDLGELGSRLQSEIAVAVEHLSSCPVRIVHIVFLEPSAHSSKTTPSSAKETPYGSVPSARSIA